VSKEILQCLKKTLTTTNSTGFVPLVDLNFIIILKWPLSKVTEILCLGYSSLVRYRITRTFIELN